MRTLADVQRIKAEESARRGESAVTGFPPGYIFGLDLAIRDDALYVMPGVASIRGKAVTLTKEYLLSSDHWTIPRSKSTAYYVYLDVSGKFSVDHLAPALAEDQYYKKSPATGARFLGAVRTDDANKLSIVVSRDPVHIGAGATFEPGYDPKSKVDTVGGKYATAEGDRSKLEIFPDGEHALRVRRWNDITGTYSDVLKVLVDGSGEGDIIIGSYDLGGCGLRWDDSDSVLRLRGAMTQENGVPYPTTSDISKFFYDESVPCGPYKAGDFWVHDDAIFISKTTREAGQGVETDWEWYIRPNVITDVQSTNGDKFRPGQSVSTTLIPRVFRNGTEITSTLPDSAFRWSRASFFPQLPPNDDITWNASHATGYRTIEVTTDSVYARATYTLEILE